MNGIGVNNSGVNVSGVNNTSTNTGTNQITEQPNGKPMAGVTYVPPTIPPKKEKKKKKSLTPFWIIIIVFLILGMAATYLFMNQQLQQAKYNCTPVTTSKEEMNLDINSTIVQTLYSKVVTDIKEDIASPYLNDTMKLYLAYRQIAEHEKYNSNCNQFDQSAMEPYKCKVSTTFTPKAFKEETLKRELKELYGENLTLTLKNIQLGNNCLVGYQYIPSRGEFVEGYCKQQTNTSLTVTKTLEKAVSSRNTIVLTEKVKYRSNSGGEVPKSLKDGIYHYIFRLDMNYNYVLVDKTYESGY